MNAPNAITPHFATVLLTDIALSTTHIQQMRRARFDPEKLKELGQSIATLGLQQPVVLRPHPAPTDAIQYELVAGERRYLACQAIGITAIDARISALTDEQALEIQLVENLQREGLHEIEEAEGYQDLMKLKGIKADAVGELIGKSRSYVFARLKLLDLCPEGRAACYSGAISVSVALLVARIPRPEMQAQCIAEFANHARRAPVTYHEAQEHIEEDYMVDLKGVSWKLNDATLLPSAGSCTDCPKRSGNQKDLFTDIKNPNVCTDPQCHGLKAEAARDRLRQEHLAKGQTVFTGNDAEAIKPHAYGSLARGYVRLDEETYLNGKYQTYRAALGKHAPETALLEDPYSDKLIPIIKSDQLAKALKAAGIEKPRSSNGSGRDTAAIQKAQIETRARMAILQAIREANRIRAFDGNDTIAVAQALFNRTDFDSQKRLVDNRMAEAGLEKPKGTEYVHDFSEQIPQLPTAELASLMIDLALIGHCHASLWGHDDEPEELHAAAARVGVDAQAIRKRVVAEAKVKKAK